MTRSQWILFAINVVGGVAVLGSYAVGLLGHPGEGQKLWGGVPAGLRPLYTVSMLTAAVGYLVMLAHLLLRVDPAALVFPGGFGFGALYLLFALILVPSALWLPLTFSWLAAPSTLVWVAIRVVLSVTGLGALALLALLVGLRFTAPALFSWLAVVGAAAFAFQTAVLDAIVWVAWFRR